jgi:acylphosphatase
MKCYKITVSGKVQGVGYRYSAKSMARALGINGIVRNMANRDVYIEAEGSEAILNDFIKWCKKGPEHSIVKDVSFTECETKGYSSFDVVH